MSFNSAPFKRDKAGALPRFPANQPNRIESLKRTDLHTAGDFDVEAIIKEYAERVEKSGPVREVDKSRYAEIEAEHRKSAEFKAAHPLHEGGL